MVSFGVMFRPGQFRLSHVIACLEVAEDVGFGHAWFGDSHVIWHEAGPYLTAAALSTSRLRVGPLVANPVTRHPTVVASTVATLAQLFDGRAVLGLGRGDSAVRTLGLAPMPVKEFRTTLQLVRALGRGEEVTLNGMRTRFAWLTRAVPVLVAAYGPKVLRLAGELADGLILQLASPGVVEWAVTHARRGAEAAGRPWHEFEVVAAAPSYISADRERALSRVRGFPATVSNHVRDLLAHYRPEDLPSELVEGMERIEDYDYLKHGHHDAPHVRAVTDEMAERLTLIGTVEAVREKIRRLADRGVTQVCLYLGVVEPELHFTLLETYGREIIPAFR
ncbi:MAG: TIGR03842 family LLM class F420-dependent oxidoreductase [Candidatus Rokubacteria bacterium]|nr:TIGR03842 family LLM class F420-dependent oxidoreductase [Candidatus Rokubacteria bacterium]